MPQFTYVKPIELTTLYAAFDIKTYSSADFVIDFSGREKSIKCCLELLYEHNNASMFFAGQWMDDKKIELGFVSDIAASIRFT